MTPLAEIESPVVDGNPEFCAQHQQTPLSLFCHDCFLPICPSCSSSPQHSNHRCADLAESAPDLHARLKTGCVPLAGCISANHSELEKLNVSTGKLLEQIRLKEQLITKQRDQLHNRVENQYEQLLARLGDMKIERTKKVEERKKEVEGQVAIMESFQKRVEIVEAESPLHLVYSVKGMLERAEGLVAEQREFNKGGLSPVLIDFKAAELPPMSSASLFGELTCKGLFIIKIFYTT